VPSYMRSSSLAMTLARVNRGGRHESEHSSHFKSFGQVFEVSIGAAHNLKAQCRALRVQCHNLQPKQACSDRDREGSVPSAWLVRRAVHGIVSADQWTGRSDVRSKSHVVGCSRHEVRAPPVLRLSPASWSMFGTMHGPLQIPAHSISGAGAASGTVRYGCTIRQERSSGSTRAGHSLRNSFLSTCTAHTL
jgi:hypothetical protein